MKLVENEEALALQDSATLVVNIHPEMRLGNSPVGNIEEACHFLSHTHVEKYLIVVLWLL